MAAFAHVGVGFAAKRIAPKVPVWILIVCAWALDLAWGIFYAIGVERYPTPGVPAEPSPWSHGLFMSIVWSLAAGGIAWVITRSRRTSVIIGLLVFSHWILDALSHPMTAYYPNDTKLPIFFASSPSVGLGLYSTVIGTNVTEYGTLILGIGIYVTALAAIRKEKRTAAGTP